MCHKYTPCTQIYVTMSRNQTREDEEEEGISPEEEEELSHFNEDPALSGLLVDEAAADLRLPGTFSEGKCLCVCAVGLRRSHWTCVLSAHCERTITFV